MLILNGSSLPVYIIVEWVSFHLIHVYSLMSSLANECPFGNVGFPHVPVCGYMLPNLSPSPNLYKVQSVYNKNVAL